MSAAERAPASNSENRLHMKSFKVPTFRALLVVATACLAALSGGCGTSSAGYAPGLASPGEADYEYVIGAGDSLSIFVWGYEDLSITLPVRPDGKITTRLVEDMQASGKTPTQLARDIEQVYREFVKNPTVSITVSDFVGSPAQQIKVVGGGSKPRTIPYKNGMTLLDLMIEAGGLSEYASGNNSVLVRNESGERVSYKVRVSDLLERGDITANVPIFPGDILIIPESWL